MEDKKKVETKSDVGRKFRLSGGEILKAIKKVKFLENLAGKSVSFASYVVDSKIPLLWSKPSMAKAGVIINLPEDTAMILGNKVDLDLTSAGHYSLPILPQDRGITELNYFVLPEEEEERKKVLLKIHRQFGHPREETLLKC